MVFGIDGTTDLLGVAEKELINIRLGKYIIKNNLRARKGSTIELNDAREITQRQIYEQIMKVIKGGSRRTGTGKH